MATMPLALMALIWLALVLSMSTSSIFWAPVALSRMFTSTDPSICQFHEVPGRSCSMPVGGASVVVVVVVGVVGGSVDVVVDAGVVVVLCCGCIVVVVLQRWRRPHPAWCDAAPAAWAAAAVNVTSSSTKAALRILRMSGLVLSSGYRGTSGRPMPPTPASPEHRSRTCEFDVLSRRWLAPTPTPLPIET